MTGSEGHRLFLQSALRGGHSEQEARALWSVWLRDRLGDTRTQWMLDEQRDLDSERESVLREDAAQLAQGLPLQYILGSVEFADVRLRVGPGVLVPRPETEAWVLNWTAQLPPNARVMDVCSGSGCMALAVAHARPDASVFALEWSEKAMPWLLENAEPFRNLEVMKGNALGEPPQKPASLDLLLSNPPYIPVSESLELAKHVRDFEPAEALFVPDEDPLLFYRSLRNWGAFLLQPGGWISVECHTEMTEDVRSLFQVHGWSSVFVEPDIFERPRFVSAQWVGIFTP